MTKGKEIENTCVMVKEKKCQFEFDNLVLLCIITTATDISASNIILFSMLFNENVYFKILQYDNFLDIEFEYINATLPAHYINIQLIDPTYSSFLCLIMVFIVTHVSTMNGFFYQQRMFLLIFTFWSIIHLQKYVLTKYRLDEINFAFGFWVFGF